MGANSFVGATLFSRKHPLSCWFSSILTCFAGSIVANCLMGESVVIPFKKHEDVLLATAVWLVASHSIWGKFSL